MASPRRTLLTLNNGPEALATLATINAPVLSDDLYQVIRSIVSPPPSIDTWSINAGITKLHGTIQRDTSSTEKLFTRRPTEKSLLEKLDKQASCAGQTSINLEELFIQIVEPKKYTNKNDIMQSISIIMTTWPKNQEVQEKALACLVCLNNQTNNFHVPQNTITCILEVMQEFRTKETIQRLCVKLMKSKSFLGLVRNKVAVLCCILNSLCILPGVDDFMISAELIVRELKPSEKALIRKHKQYVAMLMDFPYRQNDKITVCLCWSALDTLILLADYANRWDELLDLDGEAKIRRLSHRPELEDRCNTLLEKVLLNNDVIISAFEETQLRMAGKSPVVACHPPSTDARNFRLQNMPASKVSGEKQAKETKRKQPISGLILNSTCDKVETKFQSVDELVTRKQPTPPPTTAYVEDDLDGWFSDDENMQMVACASPTFCSPSTLNSPPPETSLFEDLSCQPVQSYINQDMQAMRKKQESDTIQLIPVQLSLKNDDPCVASSNQTAKPLFDSKPNVASFCIICNEPKEQQALLLQQLRQSSHCLLQPCNLLLRNCIKSNLCESHSW